MYANKNNPNLFSKFGGVIGLTSKNFVQGKVDQFEFNGHNGLIMFYAPWCGHCQDMAEMWSELAIQFMGKFAIGAVNCEDENSYAIRNQLRIKRYPTFKYISHSGHIYNYDGNADTKDDFIYYIHTKI